MNLQKQQHNFTISTCKSQRVAQYTLAFTFRLTGSRFVNPLGWNRHESSLNVDSISRKSIRARLRKCSATGLSRGWLKMLSIRQDSIESTRLVSLYVDLTKGFFRYSFKMPLGKQYFFAYVISRK